MEEALGCHHLLKHEKCNDDVGGLGNPPVDMYDRPGSFPCQRMR